MSEEQKSKYAYQINQIKLKDGTAFSPGKITVFVGANNCGKTQLLKDLLGYITGSRISSILLDNLDIPYPDTWDQIKDAYSMEIIEANGSMQLKHISPTLDAVPSGPQTYNLIEYLQGQLKQVDKRGFREATGASMVTYLNTDNRLSLTKKCHVQNLQSAGPKNVLEALYHSELDVPSRIRNIINDTFETDIYFDYTDPGTLQFRIDKDFSNISPDSRIAYTQVSSSPILDNQGDGLRSFAGIICALMSLKKPIILLDEPEAFLHPPQAMKLGENISQLIQDSQQIFIATHSADFLRGLLSRTRDATIVHLSRSPKDEINTKVLTPAMLNKIILDPLLSSSRVLEGMFYKGVVATEADSDAVFYQRLYQRVGTSDEIHFVNVHNKQTLKKVIQPYQSLGVKFALIADVDLIRDEFEFRGVLDGLVDGDLHETILNERRAVYDYFQKQSKHTILAQLQSSIIEFASRPIPTPDEDPEKIASALFDFRKELNRLREDSDELADLKKRGRSSIENNKAVQKIFDSLILHCASVGLFIVPVGELESWLVDYGVGRGSNKSKWIVNALNKLYKIDYDEEKEIWKFIISLKQYLVS